MAKPDIMFTFLNEYPEEQRLSYMEFLKEAWKDRKLDKNNWVMFVIGDPDELMEYRRFEVCSRFSGNAPMGEKEARKFVHYSRLSFPDKESRKEALLFKDPVRVYFFANTPVFNEIVQPELGLYTPIHGNDEPTETIEDDFTLALMRLRRDEVVTVIDRNTKTRYRATMRKIFTGDQHLWPRVDVKLVNLTTQVTTVVSVDIFETKFFNN